MVRVHNSWICAACKPIFLQRLNEGAPAPASMTVCRSGKLLVVTRTGSVFPNRCIKCNTPVQGKLFKRTLHWYPPWVFLIGGIIAAMFVRKSAQIELGLCEVHRKKRIRNILLGCGLFFGGLVFLFVSAANEWGIVALLSLVVLIAGIVFMVMAIVVSAARMNDKYAWIKGAGKPFLDMLPEWRDGY
jgi:hypothetical protein